MTKQSYNDPEHWRERAEEARTIAEQMADEQSRESMLRVANEYDSLAARALARLNAASQSIPNQSRGPDVLPARNYIRS